MCRNKTTYCLFFALSIAAVLGLANYIAKNAAADENLKQEILRVSDEREQALAKGDVAALDQIDADDLVYTNWRGVTPTKAEHQTEIKARNCSRPTIVIWLTNEPCTPRVGSGPRK